MVNNDYFGKFGGDSGCRCNARQPRFVFSPCLYPYNAADERAAEQICGPTSMSSKRNLWMEGVSVRKRCEIGQRKDIDAIAVSRRLNVHEAEN